ncbi:MAG: YlxR family protein [Armatimonadetes bacterium]|nr:YlxR family protein [Anaerolineae bacterium]
MTEQRPTNAPRRTPKHIPQRTCVVCRSQDAKRQLTRLVRTADAGVQLDPTGKQAGRGAYLCESPACWARAAATDVVAKALRTSLTVEDRARIQHAAPTS